MVKKPPSGPSSYASGYQLQGVVQTKNSPIADTPSQVSNPCVGVIIGEATVIFLRITLWNRYCVLAELGQHEYEGPSIILTPH